MPKLYYYLGENKTPLGPVSIDDLWRMFLSESITRETLIAPQGEKNWCPVSQLWERNLEIIEEKRSEELPEVPDSPAINTEKRGGVSRPEPREQQSRHTSSASGNGNRKNMLGLIGVGMKKLTEYLHRFNGGIDHLFNRQADWALQKVSDKVMMKEVLSMVNALTSVLSCLLLLIYGGWIVLKFFDKPVLIIPLILGIVVVQYMIYLVNQVNAELAIQDDIGLSSMLWPRLLGVISYVLASLCVVGTVLVLVEGGSGWVPSVLITLIGAVFSFFMFALYWRSNHYLLKINSENASGGTELASIVRYVVRFNFLILQVGSPLLILAGLIIAIVNPRFSHMLMMGSLILLPLVNYLAYVILNLIPDFLDCILRKGVH